MEKKDYYYPKCRVRIFHHRIGEINMCNIFNTKPPLFFLAAAFALAVIVLSIQPLHAGQKKPAEVSIDEKDLFKSIDYAAAAKKLPEAQVIKVLDGDTFRVKMDGKTIRIRLIGIDTPESTSNQKSWRDAKRQKKELSTILGYGEEAAEFVRQIVKPGDSLYFEYDVTRYDKYGRLLVYAYLPGGKMINEFIIESGYAYPLTIPPNVKYKDRFDEGYRKARSTQSGLWK